MCTCSCLVCVLFVRLVVNEDEYIDVLQLRAADDDVYRLHDSALAATARLYGWYRPSDHACTEFAACPGQLATIDPAYTACQLSYEAARTDRRLVGRCILLALVACLVASSSLFTTTTHRVNRTMFKVNIPKPVLRMRGGKYGSFLLGGFV